MSHPKGAWPSDAVTTRIVDAVGQKYAGNLDRDALRTALHDCRWDYLSRSTKQRAFRERKAKEIARQAESLAGVLYGQSTGDRLLDLHLWFSIDQKDTLAAELCRLSSAARTGGELGADIGPIKHWLVVALAPIYKQHFKRKPRCSRSPNGGAPYGPFVRFVQQVGTEIGLQLSAETVDKAAKSARVE